MSSHCTTPGTRGHPLIRIKKVLQMYLSDPAIEDTIYGSYAMWQSV